MRKLFLTLALTVSSCLTAFGQSAESATFITALSPRNEVPAVDINASGTAVVRVHVVRNAGGQIVSGSADFTVLYSFPSQVTFTGLHIHAGAAGVNGPVTVNTGIAAGANSILADETGRGVIVRQAQTLGTDTAGLDTLRGLFTDPSGYYVNLHTTANPGGVIRGQLVRAQETSLIGLMSTRNEVPAITDLQASGLAHIRAVRGFDARGNFLAGYTSFDIAYNFPGQQTFTGLHIHASPAGVNGPVTINTGIAAGARSVTSESNGQGRLFYHVAVEQGGTAAIDTLNGLFGASDQYYVNLHTTTYPGGVIRSQLFVPEWTRFNVNLSPANEVPAITTLTASAPGFVDVFSVRDATGAITNAAVEFNLNFRFPAAVEFTGLHIHDAAAGVNGPVTINTGIAAGANSVASDAGSGNISRIVMITGGQALTSVNSLLSNPENHYVNLHTTVNPGGAVRAQLAAANTRRPSIVAAISSVSDASVRTVANGGLITIFGTDFAKVPYNLGGLVASRVPTSANGTSVTIGGVAAPIVWLGYDPAANPSWFIVAQVPYETQTGTQPVVVKNSNGESGAMMVTVAATAPAIYFDSLGGIALNADTLTLIRPDSPAKAGDSIAFLMTGLGRTLPTLATGQYVSELGPIVTGALTATIGGQAATVSIAGATPFGAPFLGTYLVAVTVPSGIAAGDQPVVIRAGQTASNTVRIRIR